MYNKNNSGPNTQPWGTPDVTDAYCEDISFRTTACFRNDKYSAIHAII